MTASDFVSPNCFPISRETKATKSIALVRSRVKREAPTAVVSASKFANEATRSFAEKTGKLAPGPTQPRVAHLSHSLSMP